jgi:hypothetical protein
VIQRGLAKLLILAKHLARFEKASEVCYLFKENSIHTDGNTTSAMIKLPKLSKLVVTNPLQNPVSLEDLEKPF